MSISSNADFQDNGNFKWGIGKDDSQNFYINDTWNNTARLKIDYQNSDLYLRGNVIVDSIFGSGSKVSASKFKMISGANDGYIAVSDPNGEMTWTDPLNIPALTGATGATGNDRSHWSRTNGLQDRRNR